MSNPAVSIIIPIYNADRYLRQCLESVNNQSFTRWECILVDDGSSDSSSDICKEFVANDERFKLIQKTNGGVSSARNTGIDKSMGTWLFFSDADDTLDVHCLEVLYNAVENETEFVMAGYSKMSESGEIKESYPNTAFCEISTIDAIKQVYQPTLLSYQGYLWCKLFRADIVKNDTIRFNERIYFNEDRLFIIQYLCRLQGAIQFSTTSVYNYIERASGAVNSVNLYYNRKFVTDFEAFVLMRDEIFSYTEDRCIRQMANEGIAFSYIANHELMYKFNHYDSEIHWRLFNKLFKTGAVRCLFKGQFESVIKAMFFVFIPQLIRIKK